MSCADASPFPPEELQARHDAIHRLIWHAIFAAGLGDEVRRRIAARDGCPFEVVPTDLIVTAADRLNPANRFCDAPGCDRIAVAVAVGPEAFDYCADHRPAPPRPEGLVDEETGEPVVRAAPAPLDLDALGATTRAEVLRHGWAEPGDDHGHRDGFPPPGA